MAEEQKLGPVEEVMNHIRQVVLSNKEPKVKEILLAIQGLSTLLKTDVSLIPGFLGKDKLVSILEDRIEELYKVLDHPHPSTGDTKAPLSRGGGRSERRMSVQTVNHVYDVSKELVEAIEEIGK